MKKLKCKKGITLVTLMITVIILIILATLTFSMVTGDGIFKYARNEQNKIGKLEQKYNEFLNKEGGFLNSTDNSSEEDDTPTTGDEEDDTPTTGDDEDITIHPPHILDAGVITKAATCIATGVRTYSCTVEGCDYTETVQVPKDSNNHEKAKEVVISPATCVSDAIKYMYCSACSTQWDRVVTQTAYGHSWVGSYSKLCEHKHEAYYKCLRCEKEEWVDEGHYPRGYEYQYTYGTYGAFTCICSQSLIYYPTAERKR